ncbi:FAD-dependent oxidoreductase [Latilactobacillus sakei]|uniref:FAD-dependent oxidoreductase n=1 Tax=Latilactobacillus sakei TaxID=1599 RepID=UPI003F534747
MKIIVIGSVAAGTSVAAKARRNNEENEITVYEKGKDISYSVCGMPFYLGGEVEALDTLIPRDAKWFKQRFNVDIITETEVVSIDEMNQTVMLKDLTNNKLFENRYDRLVLATGAAPRVIKPFDKHYKNAFTMHNMADTRAIDAYLKTQTVENVVVFGTGYVGLEMMEQFRKKGLSVTLVQRSSQIMTNFDGEIAYRAEQVILENGVNIIKGVTAQKVFTENGQAKTVLLSNGVQIPADLILLATGVIPQTQLLDHTHVEKGESGALKVDTNMATSIPNIYAVGDVVESFSVIDGSPLYRPMGSTANKMGRIAGDVLTGGSLAHRGVLGTGIIRLFDTTIAQAGFTEKVAREKGYDIEVLYNIKPGHADYLSGTENVIKAIANRQTGKLLGVQIIGKDGVDKRIDVFVTAITFGAKVADLFHLDLAYQPLYATTKDPVLYTGMALENALHGRPLLTPTELYQLLAKGTELQVIDVRSKKQYEAQHIETAISMPLADIRTRSSELNKNVPTIAYCNKGVSGNAAQNLLLNLGFKTVYNLSGGHKNYQMVKCYLEDK